MLVSTQRAVNAGQLDMRSPLIAECLIPIADFSIVNTLTVFVSLLSLMTLL